jgi:hypothetical protein
MYHCATTPPQHMKSVADYFDSQIKTAAELLIDPSGNTLIPINKIHDDSGLGAPHYSAHLHEIFGAYFNMAITDDPSPRLSLTTRSESPFHKALQQDAIFHFAYYSAKKIPRCRPSLRSKAYIMDPYLWVCYCYQVPLCTGDVIAHGVEHAAAQTFRDSLRVVFPKASMEIRDQLVRVFISIVAYVDVQHRLTAAAVNPAQGISEEEVCSTLEVMHDLAQSLLQVAGKKK